MPGFPAGRLTPLALDRAQEHLALPHVLIQCGGLSQAQIAAVPLPRLGVLWRRALAWFRRP